MAAEGQSDKIASDMQVYMNWVVPLNSSMWKESHLMTLTNTCSTFLDVSTVRRWVVHFSSGKPSEEKATFQTAMHGCHIMKWRVSWSANSHGSADYDQRTVFGAEYCFRCIASDGGSVGILQSSHQVGCMNALTETERTPYTSLSGPTESIWCWRCQFPASHHYCWWDMVLPLWARHKTSVHESGDMNSTQKKMCKMQPWVGKVMCTVCWDRNRVILLDFLGPRQIMNSNCYTITVTKQKAWTSRIRPEKKTIFFLQHSNTRLPNSLKIMGHIDNLGWTVLPYPLCSFDLVPSVFYLFRPMKDELL